MQRRRSRDRISALAALVLASAVAGCGGGGGGGDTGAEFEAGPVEVADPGSTRPVGERAFVEYEGLGPAFEPTARTTLAVTVEQVDEGDSSDIEGLGESTVPYYVHVEYENHGDGAISLIGLSSHLTVQGSDGEVYDAEGVVEISGEFEQCPDADREAPLEPEQAIDDCLVIPLAEGVSPEQIRFQGNLAAEEEPIAWTVE